MSKKNFFILSLNKMSRVISYNINPNINVQDGVHKTYFIVRGRRLTRDEIAAQKPDNFDPDGFYFNPLNDSYVFYYPKEFVTPSETGEDKYLVFQYCHLTLNESLPADIEVHASFIPRDNYCDSLVYYTNLQPPDDNRKYKVNTNKKMGFEVWFTNSSGKKKIVPDDFVIFMKLIY